MRTKKIGIPLDNFKLFYEEIVRIKRPANRVRRVRQAQ